MNSIEETKALITLLHEGQVDQVGQPYKDHPLRVAENVQRTFPGVAQDVIHAALLHDVIEDCGETRESLMQKGYSRACVDMVFLVSHADDGRAYDQIIEDLAQAGNKGAMMIKIADNMDNSHPERVAQLRQTNPEKAERLVARYRRSIERLSKALEIDPAPILDALRHAPPLRRSPSTKPGL